MKFTIGRTDAGDLLCDLDRLIGTRLLVQANSGAGKSWCLRRILEQTHGHVQHLVIDPEGEFPSLREKFDYVLAALRAHPCRWALIRAGAKAFGPTQAKRARELHGSEFEFVGRRISLEQGGLYGRFVGASENEEVDGDGDEVEATGPASSPERRRIAEVVDRERQKRRGHVAADT